MKNNNFHIILIAILVVLLCTANVALAAPIAVHGHGLKSGIVRLTLAMLGVGAFTIIIAIGLSLYNRFFVPNEIKNYKLGKNSLRSPSDKDEAIIMYLSKNKLK